MLTHLAALVLGAGMALPEGPTSPPSDRRDALSALAIGDRVRVSVDGKPSRLVGQLLAWDADTLSLVVPSRPEPVVVRRSAVQEVAVSRGRASLGHRLGKGAGIGLLTGMGAGMLTSFIASPCLSDPGRCDRPFADKLVVGGIIGAAFSVIAVPLGAIMGASSHAERWERVNRRLELSIAPRPRGVAIATRLTF